MPKTYSEQEKEYIIKRLKEEAAKCLAQYGIRRTTVDELVKRAQIPKGTFYLFYSSKEQLLFEVLDEMQDVVEERLKKLAGEAVAGGLSCDSITEMILQLFYSVKEMPVFQLINSGEIEILVRKLPSDSVRSHFLKDDHMVEHLLKLFPRGFNKSREVYSTAFRFAFLAMVANEELQDENGKEGLRLLIRGLVLQLME